MAYLHSIQRIKEAAQGRQRGVQLGMAIILQSDLIELLRDWQRLDDAARSAHENNVVAKAGEAPMRQALQVCVKALEFRKERSANDEFALNLARIALAEAPRATADVERDAARYRWLTETNGFRLSLSGRRASADLSEMNDYIDAAIETTKPAPERVPAWKILGCDSPEQYEEFKKWRQDKIAAGG